jgi:hypothetical protein
MKTVALIMCFAVLPNAAIAAPTIQSSALAPDAIEPARLAAAKSLIDVILPPQTRDSMMEQMLNGAMANVSEGLQRQLASMKVFADEPETRAVLGRFMKRQQDGTIASLKENFPGMIDAMAKAYARRFTVAEMDETNRFFSTPTGNRYITQSMTIMNDPDVSAWQQSLMAKSMERIPGEIDAFVNEITALRDKKNKK